MKVASAMGMLRNLVFVASITLILSTAAFAEIPQYGIADEADDGAKFGERACADTWNSYEW